LGSEIGDSTAALVKAERKFTSFFGYSRSAVSSDGNHQALIQRRSTFVFILLINIMSWKTLMARYIPLPFHDISSRLSGHLKQP
jgi:hypothetical protein